MKRIIAALAALAVSALAHGADDKPPMNDSFAPLTNRIFLISVVAGEKGKPVRSGARRLLPISRTLSGTTSIKGGPTGQSGLAFYRDGLDGTLVEKGKIIHQSSTAAYLGNVGLVSTEDPDQPMPPFHYSVAKIGISGLTKYMAGALGPWGINVNAIAPGVTMTEATKKIVPEEIMSGLVMFSALRKPLEPEDLTGTAVFLACEDSDLMTGQVLVVDGGMIMLG